MFTYQYAQPDAYHFSMDSIHLAEYVAEQVKTSQDVGSLRVLDLCAGCGVIGFELSWYAPEIRFLDFIEVQEIYTDYFNQNVAIVNRPELQIRWHLLNYDQLVQKEWSNQYDLIVSNPPYFQPEQGMLSPSEFKNRCRFFIDSLFSTFVLAMANALKEGGRAYFLLRPLKQHGTDLFSNVQVILKETTIQATKITQIRGTDVILIQKPLA